MEIKLIGKKGGVALVDKDDYELLSNYKWFQDKDGYARGMVNKKNVSMHRFIMKPAKNMVVDHINHSRLDNTRINLVIKTQGENAKNTSKTIGNTSSKYKGVYYNKKRGKYFANIMNNYRQIFIGSFDNEHDAAIAIDMYIVHNNLEFHNLIFPSERDKYLQMEYIPFNKDKKKKATKYYGVAKVYNNKFTVRVPINGKVTKIYYGDNIILAAQEYDRHIVNNNIPHKKINFPLEYPNYNPNSKILTLGEIYNNNTVKLLINTTGDNVALVDKADYDIIKYYKCYVENRGGYVMIVHDKTMPLHRFLMNPQSELVVDHIDGKRCNNTRINLRIVKPNQNNQNRKKKLNTTSKYMGVYYNKISNRWINRICFDGIVYSGAFKNEKDAARKRDLYILEHLHNEIYKLNFVWSEKDIVYWITKLECKQIIPTELIIKKNKVRAKIMFNNIKYDNLKNHNNDSIETIFNNITKQIEMSNMETENIMRNYNEIMKYFSQ